MAKRLTIELLVMIALGLLVGLIGPFGTFDAPPAQRLFTWVIWLLAGYALFRPTGIVAHWLCEATGMPPLGGRLLALTVTSVPLTLVIIMMARGLSFSDALRWQGFWTMYLYIAVIAVVVMIAMTAIFGSAGPENTSPRRASPEPATAPIEPPTPELAAPTLPLPPGFGPVRALKGEDHYVRVIGDGREELILMRMRDAIERLGSVDGLRIHRSWWVAGEGVASVRRDGRTAIVVLKNGHEAPVARDIMPQLRAAGWL